MDELLNELKAAYGEGAEFREGQREAIEYAVNGKRVLVVQKTGWGKSLVYFLATKILKKKKNGITLIISPLLALMNNQIESAKKLGVRVKTINSENVDYWNQIMSDIENGSVDALIISPERLSNQQFKEFMLEKMAKKIMLFVVDEAHCISDWGHDFRPDYRRIVDILSILPGNISVIATTATANNRVVNDIKEQLGDSLQISRGSLMRESLSLQVVKLPSKEARMVWILQNINDIPGTGVIYCLTVNDCKLLDNWLKKNGVKSESYYAALDIEKKREIIESFMNNQIKVMIATVAFGMGFDKPDISFVIHFQRPGNIVAYYQQIGRAGRGIDNAYAILLCGGEDDEINNYFINSAFPTEKLMTAVVETVKNNPGIKIREMETHINMKRGKIEACVKYLLVNGDIYVEKGKYYKSAREWKPNLEKSERITEIRKNELLKMEEFSRQNNCYMEFIAKELDDITAKKCGKCSNCKGHMLIETELSKDLILEAQRFIKDDFNVIEARKKWPDGIRVNGVNKISDEYRCEEGLVLSNYGDSGWGISVSEGKYKNDYFDDSLVEASVALLEKFAKNNNIQWVTSVPSLRHPELVKSFAKRLSERLELSYYEVIEKITNNVCQKELNTSYLQYNNANSSFEVRKCPDGNVLLVDDMVDSRWTFTVCGYKLREKGSGKVFPFALANSAGKEEG
jgi:ATP-dependent DNA helicase, recQ family